MGLCGASYAVERLQESKAFQTWNCFFLVSYKGKKPQDAAALAARSSDCKNPSAVTKHNVKSGEDEELLHDIVADNESPLSATSSNVGWFRLLHA